MHRFDTLPPPLRAWLREAALPWSPQSALKIWNKACREGGPEAALVRLSKVEAAMLARDLNASGQAAQQISKIA